MSSNNGSGFWVVVGLGLVLIPVTIIEAAVSFIISRVSSGRRARAR
jgi:hypothetical protein